MEADPSRNRTELDHFLAVLTQADDDGEPFLVVAATLSIIGQSCICRTSRGCIHTCRSPAKTPALRVPNPNARGTDRFLNVFGFAVSTHCRRGNAFVGLALARKKSAHQR